jgi:hypothetical protein
VEDGYVLGRAQPLCRVLVAFPQDELGGKTPSDEIAGAIANAYLIRTASDDGVGRVMTVERRQIAPYFGGASNHLRID